MHRTHLVGALLAALTTAVAAPDADGLTLRSCGPDPVANTAGVLCAPPSGPCDAGTVVVSTSILVKDSECVFDLGGRALRVQRTLQVPGDDGRLRGSLVITNAGDITIAKHGRLKARGDLVRRDGIVGGGDIELTSSGTIRVAGTVDVSGDSAGSIDITAHGDVLVERGAKIRGNGISSYADLGKRFADGGSFEVRSVAGHVDVAAPIQLRGANGAYGGDTLLLAARNIVIRSKVDVSGGADGGSFDAYPGDDLTIVRTTIDVRSRGAGGDGGTIWTFAGQDDEYDAIPGGTNRIDRATLDASGSGNDEGFSGFGGWIETNSYGPVHITDSLIRADGATSPDNRDGGGGTIFMDAFGVPAPDETGPPPELDVHVDGHISARGGRLGGDGGIIQFFIGRDLDLQATIDVGGKDLAGWVIARAGRHLTLGATLTAEVERPHADGGVVLLRAGSAEVGALTITADVLATGGTTGQYAPEVLLEGCPIRIADGVTIDGSGDVAPDGRPAKFQMISGRPLELGAGSRYLAGPSGHVAAVHPPLQSPVVAPGAVFAPAPLVDVVASAALFPTCPRCGDGPGDACAPEVRIDGISSNGSTVDATVAVSSPVGLPLTGDVAICDGTGIEEVTFAVQATACADDTPIELLLNDVVVGSVTASLGQCFGCPYVGPVTYTVPLDELHSLLAPGVNRLGIRKSANWAFADRRLYWAYATVTANGVSERVPLFDVRDDSEPLGTSHFDVLDTCTIPPEIAAVDVGTDVQLCAPVSITPWTGSLPCGIHLWPFEPYHDYTLVVRATDGVVAQPSSASRAFTRSEEGSLMLNGAQCPPP